MIRPGHEDVDFFCGTEVERTPAYGKKTLFVVGLQDYHKVIEAAKVNNCEHVYFGANHSFPKLAVNDGGGWAPWETMIFGVLESGILCTLDVDVSCVEGLLEAGFTECRNFIPMISVKLPYINQLGYNATIKLDDKDFDATNHGVWCHSLYQLQSRDQFTSWSEYTKDEVLK